MSDKPVLEVINLSKRFGDVQALENVSLKLRQGSFHALLGENGAGKSTLVKCIMGFYQPDSGNILVRDKEQVIKSPEQATAFGIGMVYQHFTLIPNMTVAENFVLSRPKLPLVINWKKEIEALEARMDSMPFRVDLMKNVNHLSAGEKQKVEIVKQLLLDTQILFLDEPTSVLTPGEADEVLGKIHAMTREQDLSVLIITHKFREVMQFADEATILRKGKYIGRSRVADTNPKLLAEQMVGSEINVAVATRSNAAARDIVLDVEQLSVLDDVAGEAVSKLSLNVRAGEIVGIAGVSGNGQKELVEALSGQRDVNDGQVRIHSESFTPNRAQMRERGFFCLPEEPLRNAGVPTMSVGDNLVFRNFDQPPFARGGFLLDRKQMKLNAQAKIDEYRVRTSGPDQMLGDLSGGNVQRVILARELAQGVNVLIVSNPCFGLDFKAVAEIHQRLIDARDHGAAVLLCSEDLDEIMALSDRVLVISGGRIVHETTPAQADLQTIGRFMAGDRDGDKKMAGEAH